MRVTELKKNKYGNVACFDYTKRKIIIPEGFRITSLTIVQLKNIGVETVKAHIGTSADFKRNRHFPKFGNLISLEDDEKVTELETKLKIKRTYSGDIADWLIP